MIFKRIRPHLSYANVITTLAVFAVIAGGTAMALPGKHRVTADDLHKNAVRAKAIATGAAGSSEIKDGAVGSADIGDGQISSPDVADQSLPYEKLSSNSVVARIRGNGPISSGDGGSGNPVTVPSAGNTWTQGANEVDIFFAQVTFTQPPACGGSGLMRVSLLLDGSEFNYDSVQNPTPNTLETEQIMTARPWLFEPGSATPHTAVVRISDSCTGAGENFTLNNVAIDVVAVR